MARRLHLYERVAAGLVVTGILLGFATAHPSSRWSPLVWAIGGAVVAGVVWIIGRRRHRPYHPYLRRVQ